MAIIHGAHEWDGDEQGRNGHHRHEVMAIAEWSSVVGAVGVDDVDEQRAVDALELSPSGAL